MKDVLAGLIPNGHPELARHVAVRSAVASHPRECLPDLLAGSVGPTELDALMVGNRFAVVNVEKIAGHRAALNDCRGTSNA